MKLENSIPPPKPDYRSLSRLLTYLRPYTGQVILAVILTVSVSMLGPLRPYLTKVAIDNHIALGDFDGLVLFASVILLVVIMQGTVQYGLGLLLTRTGQRVLRDIRTALYEHVNSLPLRYFDTTPVGRIVTRVTNDVETLNELFSQGIVSMVADVLTLVWILVFMLSTDAELTGLTILILPLLLFAAFIFRSAVRRIYRRIRTLVASMNGFVNEFITGMIVVQLFRQETSMTRHFREINAKHRESQDRSVFYYATFFPVVEFLSILAICIVIFHVAGRTVTAGDAVSIGVVIMFFQYVEMFFRPIRDLTERYNILQSSVIASERIFELLDTRGDPKANQGNRLFDGLQSEIEFKDVHFSYDGVTPILKGVSFGVSKGETVAIVGATGAGKSSVIQLLLRNYQNQRGAISIDGHDINEYTLESLRKNIAYVPQDNFLFSRSVAENIRLGNPRLSDSQVMNIAEELGVDDVIKKFPDGIHTSVLERGVALSNGQRQIIAICRAMAAEPSVLVLDEATANIDSETEHALQTATEYLLQNKTAIVIAHRLSTIRQAHKIIVMHSGRVVENGTHESLMELNGVYARLYTIQFENSVQV